MNNQKINQNNKIRISKPKWGEKGEGEREKKEIEINSCCSSKNDHMVEQECTEFPKDRRARTEKMLFQFLVVCVPDRLFYKPLWRASQEEWREKALKLFC